MQPTDAQTTESSTVEFIPLADMSGEQRDAWLRTGDVPKKEAPATSTETSDAEQSAEGEPDVPEVATVSETETTQEQPKPQRRSAEARKLELAKEVQELLEKRAQLRGELTGLESAKGAKPAETPAAETKQTDGPPKRPVAGDFKTWEEYEVALDEYHDAKTEYRINETLKQREVQQQQTTVKTAWEERASKVSADPVRGKSFDEAVAALGPFLTQVGVSDLILSSEAGPEVLLYLHEHHDETMAIAKTGSPLKIAAAIGKIEARLSAKATPKADPKAEVPAKEITKAPPPPTELSGKNASPGDELADAIKAGNFAKYKQLADSRDLKR